jgi:thioredoxin:protein disulfide reductase
MAAGRIRRQAVAAVMAMAAALATAMAVCVAPAMAADADGDYLEPARAFAGQARVLDAGALELSIAVAPQYHLYRDRMSVEMVGGDARLGAMELPAGASRFDDELQRQVDVLTGRVQIRVPVSDVHGDFRVRVGYQGCADRGLCYSPQTALVTAVVAGGRVQRLDWQSEDDAGAALQAVAASASAAVAPATAAPESDSSHVAAALRSGSLPTIAGVFALAGLLLAFTPCVLPMVPILSSIIVGQGAPVSRLRGFALAAAYSLGMALVYTAFGVIAGLLGEGLAAALQNPWVLGAFALLLATLSLSMFGLFELQMPQAIQSRLANTSGRLRGGTMAGVFAMGGLSALIVGPCVAAPLAGALVYISQTRDVVIGGLALFSLAMGMSVPLLLVGLSAGALLPRAGAWMVRVKVFFGVLLLAVALWIVAPVLPGRALMLVVGSALLIAAASMRLLDRLPETAGAAHRVGKGLALVTAVLGATQIVGAMAGGTDVLQPLHPFASGPARAAFAAQDSTAFRPVHSVAELDRVLRSTGRPAVLDFYADWCVSCKEMESRTFSDAAIRARMAGAELLRVDVTANSDEDKALLRRFNLFGPPGIVFFDARGVEHSAARVIGFLPPERFKASLSAAGL